MEIPPLAALRVFDAACRQLSFTRAAEMLGMTQAAVSYQIKLLEERLGGQLFLRKPKGLELTELGRRYAGPTSDAFDLLREAFSGQSDQPETMSISTMTTVGSNWLSHRLGRFQMQHPELAVRLETDDKLTDFARQDIDVSLRYGMGKWDGLIAHELFPSELTPVMTPAYLEQHGPLRSPEDLIPLRWLNNTHRGWEEWLAMNGVPRYSCIFERRLELQAQSHLGRAVLAGDGIALLNPRFFRIELTTGTLVQPFRSCWRGEKSYWLVYPPARRNRPAIKAFRRFLQDEVEAENRWLAEWQKTDALSA
ncbi:LysR substrate-binding domain-containing protein [Paracoccus aerodenitrificans]|uniref:LysR substrate-binding domain-containing protein n=1 Tax=Paracoccus aerodenitrificans TaxID=3017781 RepID=UPI0022EFE700|nr:LysR substrate-binding domain-containing protein [Paracoccus aerodenitrificans]WBU65001.1 LysR substrate-binding domain-containing protein [Paracoccus aerodenitrificans]